MENLTKIENCFIRKDKKCGKILGGSKSCFIACPSKEYVDLQVQVIEEKLISEGIEPYVAAKERAYGEDIFCTKICGKIIESQFCIALLDDFEEIINSKKTVNVPNANVYYEYGFMTALNKHIIPLQKEGLTLAFNIRGYDTIKYNLSTFKSEIGKAIKNTIKKIGSKQITDIDQNLFGKRTFNRRMEIKGFRKLKMRPDLDDYDNLQNLFDDTIFEGYYNENGRILVLLSSSDRLKDLDEFDDVELIISRYDRENEKYSSKLKEIGTPNLFGDFASGIGLTVKNEETELEYEINRMKEITELKHIFFGILAKNQEESMKINQQLEEYFVLDENGKEEETEKYPVKVEEKDFYQLAYFDENFVKIQEMKIKFKK